jgi:hypothetical protein
MLACRPAHTGIRWYRPFLLNPALNNLLSGFHVSSQKLQSSDIIRHTYIVMCLRYIYSVVAVVYVVFMVGHV